MRIGIDFDNTLVRYDALFHRVALEEGLIPAGLPVNKNAVRDHLRAQGIEARWTEMQGTVYGARMAEAEAFPGGAAAASCRRGGLHHREPQDAVSVPRRAARSPRGGAGMAGGERVA